MSWKEAQENFKKCDTVIVPVGTLHGHGPTPISIDASSVDRLADEVGKKTGLMTLPVQTYGEDDKMMRYPGSITIRPEILEGLYTDICRSLYRNGIRKVIFLNGHGGNKEPLVRTGKNVRELGMLIAVVEWWSIGKAKFPDLWPEPRGSFKSELALGIAIAGKKEIADIRKGGYMGEWGANATRQVFGDKIKSIRFSDFEFDGANITIPIDAWDVDLECPPEIPESELDALEERGHEIIRRMTDYIANFANEFQKIDTNKFFKDNK